MKAALITALIKLGIEKGMTQRIKPKFLGLKIFALISIFIGVLFFLIALHQLLSIHYNQPLANSIFGAGFITIAIIVLIVINQKQTKVDKHPFADPLSDLQQMTQPLLDSAQQVKEKTQQTLNEHQGKIILATLLAGVLLGRLQGRKTDREERS